jgi:NAD+ synthase
MNARAVSEHLVNWLRRYASDHEKRGFVVGVSGGVDSAVASALCARTGMPLLCLEMPIHQAPGEVERARDHVLGLCKAHPRTERHHVDLTMHFEDFVTLCGAGTTENDDLAKVNTRSRLRLAMLYYYATVREALVVGTGNKVEQEGVGFFAKYGDGKMDLSPMGGLTKSEVYLLARYLNLDQRIIDAAPTDGLWPDHRTDMEQMGATYPELEWAMDLREGGVLPADLHMTERQQEVLGIYDRRHGSNLHKVDETPVAPIPRSYLA